MNYIWDIFLQAQEQGHKEEDIFFLQAEEYSPFMEQSFSCINETKVERTDIELNLLLRFADIFQDILAPGMEEDYAEFRRYLIDAALHTILYTDLRQGLTKRDIYIRRLTEELRDGTFWTEIAPFFAQIDFHKQSRLVTLVLTQMQTGSSLLIFRRALLVLYPDARLYQIKAEREKLIVYLNHKDNEANRQSLQFVQDMFLPISFELRAFWEYHFGVIGVDAVMKIDEIALY